MREIEFKSAKFNSPSLPGKGGFEDLECYKLTLDIIVNAYEMARHLPQEEKYDLANQVRRSSKSIAANIAEGYGRFHYLESLRSYYIARGELNETLAHFTNALILGYIQQQYYDRVHELVRKAESTLNGFIAYVRKQQQGQHEFGEHSVHESMVNYSSSDLAEITYEQPLSKTIHS
jgi:four helix bundle protein